MLVVLVGLVVVNSGSRGSRGSSGSGSSSACYHYDENKNYEHHNYED